MREVLVSKWNIKRQGMFLKFLLAKQTSYFQPMVNFSMRKMQIFLSECAMWLPNPVMLCL